MPEAYLSQGLLSNPFFRDALPIFVDCLLDNCCVYIPACHNSFSLLRDNWESLSLKFILRFIRKSQTEEIRYCRTASMVSLSDFGKVPLSSHLDKFSLPLKVAQDIATGPKLKLLLEFHPGDLEQIVFLALSKKGVVISSRYDPFVAATFDRTHCTHAAGETSRLVADTIRFLNHSSLTIAEPRAAQIVKPRSPYHMELLNARYGSAAIRGSKRKVESTQPRFDPLTTGVPSEPSPGKWHCIKCGIGSAGLIPLHYCTNCRATPIRQASLRSPQPFLLQVLCTQC
jgi:hypothetical protein